MYEDGAINRIRTKMLILGSESVVISDAQTGRFKFFCSNAPPPPVCSMPSVRLSVARYVPTYACQPSASRGSFVRSFVRRFVACVRIDECIDPARPAIACVNERTNDGRVLGRSCISAEISLCRDSERIRCSIANEGVQGSPMWTRSAVPSGRSRSLN